MKNRTLIPLILILCGLMTVGCVSDDDFRMQTARVNNLQMEVRDLKEQVKLRDMELERQLGQTREYLPDLRLELDRMRSELQRLTDIVEVTEQRGTQAEGETLSLKDQLALIRSRLDRLEATLKLPPLDRASIIGEGAEPGTEGQEPQIEVKPEEGAPSVQTGSDEEEYRVAESLYKQQQFEAAVDKFRDFVTRFSGSKYGPSAQFYVGECLYEQKKYEEAILEYQKVIKSYPKSSKTSIALLKQAFSFLNIGDKTSAKLLLQKVIREHPDSYSAGVAKKKLPTIK